MEEAHETEECTLIKRLVQRIVDDPEAVRVEAVGRDTATSLFLIHVAERDRGKVIGRQGRVVEALRTIFGVILAISRRQVAVEVADSHRQTFPQPGRSAVTCRRGNLAA